MKKDFVTKDHMEKERTQQEKLGNRLKKIGIWKEKHRPRYKAPLLKGYDNHPFFDT